MTAGPATGAVTYEVLEAAGFDTVLADLGEILADAVDSGASVNFLHGLTVAEATDWWAEWRPDVAAGAFRPVIARLDGRVAGVAVLVPTGKPNSPHRAEVVKVLVHRSARRRGIAGGLMQAIEALAVECGHWLLVLDTTTGCDADRLYRRLGWVPFGDVPNHALTATGELSDTTYFYKDLHDR